jgi:uncharacterized protein YuzE
VNKIRLKYYDEDDVLHVVIAEGPEASSVEINPNITAELDEKGGLIGIEILNASSFIRDTVLESVQGKLQQSQTDE